jgi:mycofactocin precursor
MNDEPTPAVEPSDTEPTAPAVEEDLLVEDVSIDGMCGVY